MKVLNENPPNLDKIIAAGMNPNVPRTVFTYGDILYNPGGLYIPEHLLVHEETHTRQQGNDPDAWWDRYIKDPEFRLQQEAKAYGRQYAYLARGRDFGLGGREVILKKLARILSSQTYGNLIDFKEAKKLIQRKAYV